MANVLQDYFSRMNALNRQRGMTGNMQYGRSLDPSIAEGYFDSYQKNKLQSQTLANQKRGLDIQEKGVDADISYKEWSKGFQERGQEAQIEYNLKMLGFRGEELANMRDYQMAQIALGNRNAAAQEKYWGESTDIARENSAIDRMYKQGLLSNQAAATEAQRDAARASLITGGIGGIMNFTGTALGVWDKSRQFAADMRSKGFDAQGNKLVSPAAASDDVYAGAESGYGGYTGMGSLNYNPQNYNPIELPPPAYDTSGYGGYTGMGSLNFNPSAYTQPWSFSNPSFFINDIFFNVPDIPSYVDPSYGYSYDPSIY